jgi:tRNA threonylcarbamoyladenosine modification (KEOPS) complex  Pcc1 subunit
MKPRRAKAEARVEVDVNPSDAEVILSSLKPEVESLSSNRSRVKIERSGNGVMLIIVADDVTALRAAVNSYLHWIQGIIDIGKRIR